MKAETQGTVPVKVKLVAVAKDEAAYLPDWIFHHLYFGVDEIEIHINRTTDNSVALLSRVSELCSNVRWFEADWVDMCPASAKKQIQFIVYAKALEQARRDGQITHLLFLDIDEFWCPQDFSQDIKHCIEQVGADKPIFFEWLNDLGDGVPFSGLPQRLTGNLSPLGKTLLPVSTDIRELRHHVPHFHNSQLPVLVDGRQFCGREHPDQAVAGELNSLKSSFVFHRAHRSETEYVSLLYRGRPGNQFAYKNNRNGLPRRGHATLELVFPDAAYARYQAAYQAFMHGAELDDYMQQARAFVEQRYQLAIDNMSAYLPSHYKDMVRIFKGVALPEILRTFRAFRQRRLARVNRNVELLKQFARDAAATDLDEAIGYLERAHELRPKGPQIKALLEELRHRKAMVGAAQSADGGE
ncbi:glycosyltransferase family 2 protein [Bowmanella denitrificans]|uniref:glycosyltransferase family 2 protein n=1 Tax=Bowmanella denitrificans TaxID=366582 RepID=UPI000C9C53B5|nr:glycosyltransferase family 2 protein [Bowmanella denitrificans]